jgi:glycosyltransferase involved in cell wall biosynthesis
VKPVVSILTPTKNRRHLLPMLEICILRQTYPRDRMEWVIVDDSDDGQPPFVPRPDTGLTVRQITVDPCSIGAKRNHTKALAEGVIHVHMDDDDYYPPSRVEHAVDTLTAHDVAVVGSSKLWVYYADLDEVWAYPKMRGNHATGASLAYRAHYGRTNDYADVRKGEERSFLLDYTVPLVQLEPGLTLVCIAHGSNTVDKKLAQQSGMLSRIPWTQIDPLDRLMLVGYRLRHL